MIGLVRMAALLAYQRTNQNGLRWVDGEYRYRCFGMVPREQAWGYQTSTEFYAILDRISRGENP